MRRNSFFIIGLIITGIVMLFGSSYSLIMNEVGSDYAFVINEFDNDYFSTSKIIMKEKEIEIMISVDNHNNEDINYRLDLTNVMHLEMNKKIKYSYEIDGNYYNSNLEENTTIVQNKKLAPNSIDNYIIKINYDEEPKISLNLNIQVTKHRDKYLANVISETEGYINHNGNIRVSGTNPNNYVLFNNEKWRIIGVFKQKNNYSIHELSSVKLIKEDPIETIYYNNEDLNGNYNKSYINNYLNGIYYDNLDDKSKEFIINTEWNIGSALGEDSEKSNKLWQYIGLISPSDIMYINGNSWLNLTNALLLNKRDNKVLIYDNEIIEGDNYTEYNIYPVVFLRSDISFISGNGTFDNPYELDIIYPLNYGVENEIS